VTCWLLVFSLIQISWSQSPPSASELPATDRAKQFEKWLSDLGDADYSERQFATIQLERNKREAIDYAVQATETATGEKLDRLFQFLSSIAADPYSQDGERVYKSIADLAQNRTTSKAARAQKILQVIGEEQSNAALAKLETLKVSVADRQLQVISSSNEVKDALIIDEFFSGTAQDLECVRWLSMVEFVRLEGPKITRETLQQIVKIPNLKRLQLANTQLKSTDIDILLEAPDLDLLEFIYTPIGDESVELLTHLPVWGNMYLFGTDLTPSGQAELKSKIDGPDVLIARGGFLGVRCQATSVIVDGVVQDGAAEAAGIRARDKILTVNQVPVFVFEDIRRELANHSPGDSIPIEYERDSFSFDENGRIRRSKETLKTSATLLKRQDIPRDR